MHIGFVTIDYHNEKSGGGIGSYLSTISEELSRLGHRVSIICRLEKGAPPFEEQNGIRIYRQFFSSLHYWIYKIPLLGKIFTLPLRELEWSFSIWMKIRCIHRKDPFDLIEGCETGNLFSILFFYRAPWVIRAHGATYSFKRFSGETIGLSEKLDRLLQCYCMKKATALSAPSQFQAKQIIKEIGESKHVRVISNPVSPIFFSTKKKNVCRKEDDKSKKIILYTGRIEIRKGALVLLSAMQYVGRVMKNVELVIAGRMHVSVGKKVFEELVNKIPNRDQVKILGHVPWKMIVKLYQDCAVFAIPSYYETFCISAAEAMASGKPVVGSLNSALSEVVENGVTGILVPPGNPVAHAEAIIRLLNNENLAMEMGEAGRKKAATDFRVERITQKLLAFYTEAMAGFRE